MSPEIPYLWFWLFDFSRYMLADLVVGAHEIWTRAASSRRALPPGDPPLVSVIMAGYNEADTMPMTLASLAEQTYPNMEVIVVDDGSTDGTAEAVLAFLEQRRPPPGWCRFVREARRNGKAAALNLGLLLARGEFIVYVDADTTFDRGSIEEIVRPMRIDPGVGAVGGNLVVRNAKQNLLTQIVALEYLFSIGVGRRFRSMVGMLQVISGAFGAFRRDLVVAVGGHTPTSGNDGDLTLKIRRLGVRIAFAHRALCLTKSPATLRALIKQRRRWDRNLIKNKLRRHRDMLDVRSAGFSPVNALLVLEAIFFNIVLGARWVLVFAFTLAVAPALLPKMLLLTYLVYAAGGFAQLAVSRAVSPASPVESATDWLHVPLYPLYKMLFRPIRLYAYLEELARQASYADVFAPAAVSLEALGHDNSARMRLRTLLGALLWPFHGGKRPRGASADAREDLEGG